jgi:hypothetical protein
LLAVAFDAKRRETRGQQIPLADSLLESLAANLRLSRSGTLVAQVGA